MAYIPESNSVVAFQSDPTKLVGTVSIVGAISPSSVMVLNPVSVLAVNPTPASVQVLNPVSTLAVNPNPASVQVLNPVSLLAVNPNPASVYVVNPVSTLSIVTGNSSVQVLNPVSLLAVSQSGAPWANTNVGSIITVAQGSIAVNIIAGSVTMAIGNSSVQVLNFPTNQNVSGSVVAFQGTTEWMVKSSLAGGIFPISGSVGAIVTNNVTVVSSIAGGIFPVSGSVAAVITNTNVNVSGSVVAFLGNSTNASIITVGTAAPNQSVSGTIDTAQIGTWRVSVINSTPSSLLAGVSIFGQLPAGTAPLGSVATLQGTNPWNIAGSVAAIRTGQSGVVITSISGSLSASITGTVPVTQSNSWNVSVVGTRAATSSVYQVLSSISTVSILNANTDRKGATIYNKAETPVYVKLGTAANTSVYTVAMNNNDYYELPFGYLGVVAGITASTTGKTVTVTELT